MSITKRLLPLFDRVLLERVVAETTTIGGIVLPDSAKSKLNEFKVVATGEGRRLPDGKFAKPVVKTGDSVLVNDNYASQEIEIDNKKLYLFREDDIIGVLK